MARVGSMALVVSSCVTFASIVLLPPLVHQPDDEQKPFLNDDKHSFFTKICQRSCICHLFQFLVHKVRPIRPSLTIVWTMGHVLFAFAMFCIPFVRSVGGATFIMGVCGLTSAITSWAPFALLGAEIAKMGPMEEGYEMLETEQRSSPLTYDQIQTGRTSQEDSDPGSSTARRDSLDSMLLRLHSEDLEIFDDDPSRHSKERMLPLSQPNSEMLSRPLPIHLQESAAPTSHVVGEILGIMNVFVTLPQFIMSFVTGVVFEILEPGKSKELTEGKPEGSGVSAIAVAMMIGGIGSLVAGWLTMKLRRLEA